MSKEELNVGDIVNFTSKRFNYRDKEKVWSVIEKDDKMMRLQADDSHLIKLFPPRGKHTLLINYKYWNDCIINKPKQRG